MSRVAWLTTVDGKQYKLLRFDNIKKGDIHLALDDDDGACVVSAEEDNLDMQVGSWILEEMP